MNIKDPVLSEELKSMIQEVEQISEDLSKYFNYYTRRDSILQGLLSESNQN